MKPLSLSTLMSEIRNIEELQVTYEHSSQIYFLRNLTIEMIEPFLKYHLYKEGIQPNIHFGDYDVIQQEVLDPQSKLNMLHPDIIVIALMLENMLPSNISLFDMYDEIKEQLNQIYSEVLSTTNALLIINTFIPPFYAEWGITHSDDFIRMDWLIAEANQYIRNFVKEHSDRFFLMDWERFVRILGEEESIDYRYWYSFQAPFKTAFLDLYSREIVKTVRALKGKSKKCVVLDCDNTLWGGIVGEDGIDGIKLDKYTYPGNIFYEFQKNLLYLFERGAIICLCSKNNENDVWEVFDKHPYSLLQQKHLSAWRINWDDKVSNIQSLVSELNIGMDSVVFVDDNPMECEFVKEQLTQVTVLQVPKKLYQYPPLLIKEGLFDTLRISSEDKDRTAMYQSEARRKADVSNFTNMEDYLASLELTATIHLVKNEEIIRTAQLTQKTNQFNLTTRRYSDVDINSMVTDPSTEVFTLSVSDRHGNYGLTGVLIAKLENKHCRVDTLLLSCRILGRKLEYAFVQQCFCEIQKKHHIETWEAEYITTPKNQQVADFWNNVGFELTQHENGRKYYTKDASLTGENQISFIKIVEE